MTSESKQTGTPSVDRVTSDVPVRDLPSDRIVVRVNAMMNTCQPAKREDLLPNLEEEEDV